MVVAGSEQQAGGGAGSVPAWVSKVPRPSPEFPRRFIAPDANLSTWDGIKPYLGRGEGAPNRWGGITAGPTIFYLDEIRSNLGLVSAFDLL